MTRKPPAIESIWSRVDQRGDDECWPWLGRIDRNGYGTIDNKYAHRLIYELIVGLIDEGMTIDHVRSRGCTRRDCVNPRHLEQVTLAENARRALTKEACNQGHPFDESNTYIRPNGRRGCRACRKEAALRFKQSNPNYWREWKGRR